MKELSAGNLAHLLCAIACSGVGLFLAGGIEDSPDEADTGHDDFVYEEMMVAGSGSQGEARAAGIAAAFTKLLSGTGGPEPGEGPTQAEPDADTPGGIWTAGAAMGRRLIDRLTSSTGLTFRLEVR